MARICVDGDLLIGTGIILDSTNLSPDLSLPEMIDLQREALADNPAVDRIALMKELEKSVAAEDRARGLPAIDYIQGTWTRESERQREDWEISVQFVLPVFSWFRQRAVARAKIDRAESNEALQRALIVQSLRMAHVRAAAARDEVWQAVQRALSPESDRCAFRKSPSSKSWQSAQRALPSLTSTSSFSSP